MSRKHSRHGPDPRKHETARPLAEVPRSAPAQVLPEGAYALLNFLLDPQVNAKEALFHGYPVPDSRVEALMPEDMRNDPILHPAAELLSALEFGAAVTLTDPNRAEIMARFKAA